MLSNETRVLCLLVTPFEDGAVDHDGLAEVVEHLADRGVDGFVPCGTTGEFASLTQDERTEVVEEGLFTRRSNSEYARHLPGHGQRDANR
ncbi:dihydrodipicolinate synthase family protein [Halosimplex sp. TS25]|uniref:dihydrodipicolinate synthase family protein n=1 Tax=Halosimplex rarum TaxID=3396619 RepID=UPI0039E82347